MFSYHFIGYWGYGQERLTQRRKGAKKEGEEGKFVWDVVYVGCESVASLLEDAIAGISAAGVFDHLDVWVRLEEDRLILGREPFGKVSLFWTRQGGVIWFASQLQLLLEVIEKPEVSISGLYGYGCFSYVPNPLTPVNEVFSVAAGTEVVWEDVGSPQFRNIYQWCESQEDIQDENTAVSQLQVLLKSSAEKQVADLPDEPVGVFLSGGLDSAVVAALLVQAGVKVRAYTLDFGKFGISEYPYAEKVAEFLNIPLVKVEASPKNIKNALVPTIKALDLPFGDGVTVPLYLLNQVASQETQVIFNGEGGDQLFAGWTNKPLIAAGIYQGEHPNKTEGFIQQYLRTFHRFWGYEGKVYQPDVYAQIQGLDAQEWLLDALDSHFCPSLLHRLRRASLMLKGAQNIHPRATALGFAHGLGVRSLFCDLILAEWTFQLSGELCLHGACEKYILKRAVENWLPPEIVWRQKRGMGVPLTSWCVNDFWHDIGNWLNPGILKAENIFYPDIASQIVTGQLGGAIQGRRVGESLWLLVMWQLWRDHVFGEKLGTKSWNHPFILPSWLWKNYKQFQI
ncbi:asparagine synthase [Anabaena cylindrica FACHB-243]|uniref:asparagine synthase (glutamine-hydrolyzing) n=1 Tax=Anabaena cylindrica (strain ATCC 27899 / PCC 7122) TaxID=272123 RepID=K9ZF71_ANACC|nr:MULTISPECIES: asparagine synthetase B family protein [Anabaena]AFZ57394.1 asparagine synthase [Anabaena cylindrica PCC 7122]MBD2421076.1 asparagine synthase [Anabaena cylindrica FACHB-243]MBY5284950.1 asparagine synthase [Anabaena sp. CCAP 1446/1C]MBY5306354.1 asparagine synthase [Anabaena sp. CCAP 1446/1C]MCM2405829.1 asparagine synthetase B family protein [Anabaena sp. CCAP 1446/1C]